MGRCRPLVKPHTSGATIHHHDHAAHVAAARCAAEVNSVLKRIHLVAYIKRIRRDGIVTVRQLTAVV